MTPLQARLDECLVVSFARLKHLGLPKVHPTEFHLARDFGVGKVNRLDIKLKFSPLDLCSIPLIARLCERQLG